jgi:predicted ATPase
LTPPWPEIYVTDGERPHDFNAALAEYSRLLEAYPSLGYDVMVLPKVGVVELANIVLTAFTQETS